MAGKIKSAKTALHGSAEIQLIPRCRCGSPIGIAVQMPGRKRVWHHQDEMKADWRSDFTPTGDGCMRIALGAGADVATAIKTLEKALAGDAESIRKGAEAAEAELMRLDGIVRQETRYMPSLAQALRASLDKLGERIAAARESIEAAELVADFT